MAFHADDSTINKDLPNKSDLTVQLRKGVKESRVHSLIDFLKRPIRINSGLWSTTQAQGTMLVSLDLPKDALTSTLFQDKVQGFLGFRATAVVRVQINAQRFQQGRLLMHYIPQGQVNKWRSNVINQSLTLKTQTPRIELDCSTTTSAELKMPYVSTTTHFNFSDYTGPIGTFELCVYSPLVSNAASDVAYTVWVHFEDVELSFPTVTFTPQSGLSSTVTSVGRSVANAVGIGTKSEEELARTGSGTIGSIAHAVSNTAAKVSSSVPELSWFAAPASWVSSIVAGVADIFGWSNPAATSAQVRVAVDTFAGAQNVDGVANVHKIGLFQSNTVEILPGFAGSNTDELALSYLTRIPAYLQTFTWATTDAEDALLVSMSHALNNYGAVRAVSNGTTNVNVTDFMPFSYVAQCFRQWRGSITLTFKFIKTEFHSGRVMFYFYPYTTSQTQPPSDSDMNYIYKEVLDLRLSNEFTVTVPFVSTTPYVALGEVIGYWGIRVVNPLVAPSTVAQNISVLVEASAGPDFEVAIPRQPKMIPVYQVPSLTPQSGLGENEAEEAHHSTIQPKTNVLVTSDIDSGGLAPARFCVGEKITNLRQLLKRASLWWTFSYPTTLPAEQQLQWFCFPGDITTGVFATGSVPANFAATAVAGGALVYPYMDYYNFYGSMYMYRRGGIRLRAYDGASIASSVSATAPIVPTRRSLLITRTEVSPAAVENIYVNTAAFPVGSSMTMAQPSLNVDTVTGGLQLEVPQYARVHSVIPENPSYSGFGVTEPTYSKYHDNNGVCVNTNSTGQVTYITRQLADDANFGFFIGVLPCVALTDLVSGGTGWGNLGF